MRTPQIRLPAHGLAGGARVLEVLAVLLAHGNNEIVIVVGYYLQNVSWACFNALATSITLVRVNNYVVVT